MFLAELFAEAAQPQVVVFYPGRFQPFHLGHRDVFASLQATFGRDNVFIATSNKVELPKSPFNFSEKVAFMNAAGVPSDRIQEVVSPYKLPERYDPANTIFVVAVGAPDARRLNPGSVKKDGTPVYFQNFESLKKCKTADQHGYVIIAEERDDEKITLNGKEVNVSHGTQARNAWNMVRDDPKGREEYLVQMFGRNDPELGRILDKIPAEQVTETIRKVDGGYRLVSHTGKNLGTYPTHAGAEKRERQVQYFKHAGESVEEGVNDNFLYHATQPGGMMRILRSGTIKASYRPQEATKAITKYPTVSTTRSKQYAESDDFVNFLNLTKEGNAVIIVLDKNAIANHYKMFSTSQGTQTVGDEFEEAIVVPKGLMPIKGALKGFYFNPNRQAEIKEFEDIPWFKELLNSPYYLGPKSNVQEEAAGVGVVKNSKDPRYVMATMGDQNDVTAATLPNMMKAYGLTGRKTPKFSKK